MLRRIVFVWVIVAMPFVAQGTSPGLGPNGWYQESPSEGSSQVEIPSYTLEVEEYYSTTIKDIDEIRILITNVETKKGRGVISTAIPFCYGRKRFMGDIDKGKDRVVKVPFTNGVDVKNIAEEERDIRNHSFSFDYEGEGEAIIHIAFGSVTVSSFYKVSDNFYMIPIPFIKGESRVLYLSEEDVERLKSGKEIETKDEFERPGSITLSCHPRGEGVGGRKSSSDEVPGKLRLREREYWRSLKKNMLREQFHQEQKKYLEEQKKKSE